MDKIWLEDYGFWIDERKYKFFIDKYTISDIINLTNNIFKEGLLLHLDSGSPASFAGSGNTWNDLSGNNYNATISGATFNSNGKYFYFDGSNDYVNTNKTASQFGIYNTNYT